MKPIHLHHVFEYRDVDRAFWQEHLADWLPRRLIDAHVHITNPAQCKAPVTEAQRREYWVREINDPIGAPGADHCISVCLPERDVTYVAMGYPDRAYDLEASNEYIRTESLKRGWPSLAVLLPEWDAERVARELDKPGVIGLKPYYSLIGGETFSRDGHIEAGIFEFLPHRALEVADDRRAWITLHVPKADRLPHPDNIREIKELRRRYPNIRLVIAHLGRCYGEAFAHEAFPQLADDPNLYFDNSAVFHPEVHRLALELFGPERVLWGTDNPVFYMRGRRQWHDRAYVNRTDYPFHFNTEREPPEVEARYTLYMYEELKAIKDACDRLGFTRPQVEAIFHGNARRLIDSVPTHPYAKKEKNA